MSYEISQHNGQCIVVGAIGKDFDIHHEPEPYIADLKAMLDAMDGPTVYISDVRGYELTFGDLTGVLGLATHGDMAILRHPNLRLTIVVTSSAMIRLGANALGQSQYGALRTMAVTTLEEALEEASRDLAQVAG